MDTATLREKLHDAVDRIIDEFVEYEQNPEPTPSDLSSEDVELLGTVKPFTYHWPADYGSEDFDSAAAYRVSALPGNASVIVGWTTRNAWGRERRRAVVFLRVQLEDGPGRWYPWTEFVETDTNRFAAPIPNPERPRAIMRDKSALPKRFADKTVARSDEVFRSIREGASLRVVVDASDEAEMVRHGYWVALQRGRV